MYDQDIDGSQPDTTEYLRREGFPTSPVEIRDAEEGHELQSSTLPEPSRKRRRGWSPGCAVLFRGLSPGRLCSEDPESDEADSDDDLISCSSEANSEDTHAMSQSSSPPEAENHGSPSSPATTLISDDHGDTIVESIERKDRPEMSIEARATSSPLESEPSQVAGSETGHHQAAADEDDDQPQHRRSPTPPGWWRCNYQGCRAGLFRSKFQYDSHQVKHNALRDHHCGHKGCGRSFRRKNELARHTRSVHQKTSRACPHCETEHGFTRLDTLKRHIRRAHPDKIQCA